MKRDKRDTKKLPYERAEQKIQERGGVLSKTILLKQGEIKRLVKMKEIVEAVEMSYTEHARGRVQMPPKNYLFFKYGDLKIMPCFMESLDEAGVKCVSVHPENPKKQGLPSVMGIIELVDPETGFPIALMDGTWITNMRTGAAAGVATRHLARADSRTLGILGAGNQACTHLMALNEVMDVENVKVFCRTCTSREDFARRASKRYGFDVEAVDSAREAVENVDVVVTVTPSTKPILKAEWIGAGTHINAMGADAPGKKELPYELLKKASIFIDCWEQASHSGEINVPASMGLIRQEDIKSTLGNVLIHEKTGRTSDDEITIFDSTGLAVQDIITGFIVYKRALKDGIGTIINFLE